MIWCSRSSSRYKHLHLLSLSLNFLLQNYFLLLNLSLKHRSIVSCLSINHLEPLHALIQVLLHFGQHLEVVLLNRLLVVLLLLLLFNRDLPNSVLLSLVLLLCVYYVYFSTLDQWVVCWYLLPEYVCLGVCLFVQMHKIIYQTLDSLVYFQMLVLALDVLFSINVL